MSGIKLMVEFAGSNPVTQTRVRVSSNGRTLVKGKQGVRKFTRGRGEA